MPVPECAGGGEPRLRGRAASRSARPSCARASQRIQVTEFDVCGLGELVGLDDGFDDDADELMPRADTESAELLSLGSSTLPVVDAGARSPVPISPSSQTSTAASAAWNARAVGGRPRGSFDSAAWTNSASGCGTGRSASRSGWVA